MCCLTLTHHNFQQQCYGLHGLTQPHLISKDAILSGIPVEQQPIHPFQLVGPKLIIVSEVTRILQRLEGIWGRSGVKLKWKVMRVNIIFVRGLCVYVCMCVCACVCVHACVYVFVCVCVCVVKL